MSKKLCVFIVVFLFSIQNTKAQISQGEITYKTLLVPLKNYDKKEDTPLNLSIEKETKKLYFKLLFDKNNSFFERSIDLEENTTLAKKLAIIVSRGKGKYYYNSTKAELLHEKSFDGNLFLIEKPIDTKKWKFVNEELKIGNYTCYKATREFKFKNRNGELKTRKQIVWYTPQIPLSFGPTEFVGFPGLVLKVVNGTTTIYAKYINLGKNVKLKTPNKSAKKITEKEYEKQISNSIMQFRKNKGF